MESVVVTGVLGRPWFALSAAEIAATTQATAAVAARDQTAEY